MANIFDEIKQERKRRLTEGDAKPLSVEQQVAAEGGDRFSALAKRYGRQGYTLGQPYTTADLSRDETEQAKRSEHFIQPERTVAGTLGDVGVTALRGAVSLPEAVVGLADIPTGGRVGKFAGEKLGFRPGVAKEALSKMYSPAQQFAQRRVSEAKGFLPTIGESVLHPSTVATAAAESLPLMLGGGAIGQGITKAAGLAPVLAGAIGEGAMAAGSTAESLRQQSKDKLLSPKAALAAVGTGIGTTLIGSIGGRIAQKLGVADPDTLLTGLAKETGVKETSESIAAKMLKGGISEGILEEMPQSAQEQIWSNAALGKPLFEGVPEAAGTGLVTGAGMGAGFNILGDPSQPARTEEIVARTAVAAELKKQNLPNVELQAIKQDPAAMAELGVDAGTIDAVIAERAGDVELARQYLAGPETGIQREFAERTLAQEARREGAPQAETVLPQVQAELDQARELYDTGQIAPGSVEDTQVREQLTAFASTPENQAAVEANRDLFEETGVIEPVTVEQQVAQGMADALPQLESAGENTASEMVESVINALNTKQVNPENPEHAEITGAIKEQLGSLAASEAPEDKKLVSENMDVFEKFGVLKKEIGEKVEKEETTPGQETQKTEEGIKEAPEAIRKPVDQTALLRAQALPEELRTPDEQALVQGKQLSSEEIVAGPAQKADEIVSPVAAEDIKGEREGDVINFSEESGTIGVPRDEMPQISSEQRGALANNLRAKGIKFERTEKKPSDLKPSQKEFLPEKVQKAREYKGEERAILVSEDGHVIDGHHQWMQKLEDSPSEPIPVIELGGNAVDVIKAVKEFPSSTTAGEAPRAPADRKELLEPITEKEDTPQLDTEKRTRYLGGKEGRKAPTKSKRRQIAGAKEFQEARRDPKKHEQITGQRDYAEKLPKNTERLMDLTAERYRTFNDAQASVDENKEHLVRLFDKAGKNSITVEVDGKKFTVKKPLPGKEQVIMNQAGRDALDNLKQKYKDAGLLTFDYDQGVTLMVQPAVAGRSKAAAYGPKSLESAAREHVEFMRELAEARFAKDAARRRIKEQVVPELEDQGIDHAWTNSAKDTTFWVERSPAKKAFASEEAKKAYQEERKEAQERSEFEKKRTRKLKTAGVSESKALGLKRGGKAEQQAAAEAELDQILKSISGTPLPKGQRADIMGELTKQLGRGVLAQQKRGVFEVVSPERAVDALIETDNLRSVAEDADIPVISDLENIEDRLVELFGEDGENFEDIFPYGYGVGFRGLHPDQVGLVELPPSISNVEGFEEEMLPGTSVVDIDGDVTYGAEDHFKEDNDVRELIKLAKGYATSDYVAVVIGERTGPDVEKNDEGEEVLEDARAVAYIKVSNIEAKYSVDKTRVEGLTFPDGKVWLVDGNIEKGTAPGVLAHELGVHARKLGFKDEKSFGHILKRIEALSNTDKDVKAARERVPIGTPKQHINEETLAYLVSDAPQHGLVKRFISAVKRFLAQRGWFRMTLDKLTPADLQAMAQSAIRADTSIQASAAKGVNEFAQSVKMSTAKAADKIKGMANFKKWFGDSKVVDEDGEPLVVYHGTDKDFNIFDRSYLGLNFGFRFSDGFYFSPTKNNAAQYAQKSGETMPVYLQISSPLKVNSVPEYRKVIQDWKQQGSVFEQDRRAVLGDSEILNELGYDGVFYYFNGKLSEIVVADPTQIKSIHNTGEWSADNQDIMKSIAQELTPVTVDRKMVESPEFKRWFGKSRAHKGGMPVAFYHGSDSFGIDPKKAQIFTPEQLGKHTSSPMTGIGTFFAADKQDAAGYSGGTGNVKTVALRLENPLVINSHEMPRFDSIDSAKAWAKRQKDLNGYDGVYFPDEQHAVIFDSNQAKSLEKNTGEFSRSNEDIRFSMSAPAQEARRNTTNLNATKEGKTSTTSAEDGNKAISSIMDTLRKIGKKTEEELAKSRAKEQKFLDRYRELRTRPELTIKDGTALLSDFVRQADVPPGTKQRIGQLVKQITAAKRPETQQKRLVTALDKLEVDISRRFKTQIRNQIKRAAGPKREGAIKRGRYWHEQEKDMAGIRDAIHMPADKVAGAVNAVEAKLDRLQNRLKEVKPVKQELIRGQITDIESRLHHLNTYGNFAGKNIDELLQARFQVEEIRKLGRSKLRAVKDTWQKDIETKTKWLAKEITGQKNPTPETAAQKARRKKKEKSIIGKATGTYEAVENSIQSWEHLLDRIAIKSGKKIFQSRTVKEFGDLAHAGQRNTEKYSRQATDEMLEKGLEIFGVEEGGALTKKLQKLGKKSGEVRVKGDTMQLSPLEAAYFYAVGKETGSGNVFKGMGFTNNSFLDIDKLMTPELKAWADYLHGDLMSRVLQGETEAHRAVNGVDRAVTGLFREGQENIPVMNLNVAIMNRIYDANHYRAWAVPSKTFNNVFSEPEIRGYIEQYAGTSSLDALDKFLEDFAKSPKELRGDMAWMDKIRSNVVMSMIGANPTTFFKQLTSIPAYAADIPVADFIRNFSYAMVNYNKVKKMIDSSEMARARFGAGFDRDIHEASKATAEQVIGGRITRIRDILMLGTKIGDKMAIYAGYTVYKYHYDKARSEGKTEKQSVELGIKEFEKATERTQQAAGVKDLGSFQRGGSLQKLLTMYMTSPAAYTRQTMAAIRHFPTDPKGSAKRLLLFNVMLPMMFQAVASGFLGAGGEDEDEFVDFWQKQLRAVALGPFLGIPIARDIAAGTWNSMMGMWYGSDVTHSPVTETTKSLTQAIFSASKGLREDDEDAIKRAQGDFIDFLGYIAGLPTKPAARLWAGWEDFLSGDTEHPIMALSGYSRAARKEKHLKD